MKFALSTGRALLNTLQTWSNTHSDHLLVGDELLVSCLREARVLHVFHLDVVLGQLGGGHLAQGSVSAVLLALILGTLHFLGSEFLVLLNLPKLLLAHRVAHRVWHLSLSARQLDRGRGAGSLDLVSHIEGLESCIL